jgi:hypothetical protein
MAHLPLAIEGEDRWIGDVELGSKREDDAVRNVSWVGQEGSQEPNCTKLEGEAQARMAMTPRFQQSAVSIVEVKVEGELFWRWLSDIASIAASLLGSQKSNGHECSLPFHMSCEIICTCAWTSAKIADETLPLQPYA